MKKRDEERLLHEICRNSDVGREAIHEVLKDAYDAEFSRELNEEARRMEEFGKKAAGRLKEEGTDAYRFPPVKQKMMRAAVKMQTALSYDTSHVADMMHKGNGRGADELRKAIQKYNQAGSFATELAREMIDFEQQNQKRLEPFRSRKKETATDNQNRES